MHCRNQCLYIAFIVNTYLYITTLGLDLSYLDPQKLQTKTITKVQQQMATAIINKYLTNVTVEVNTVLFNNHKDVFTLRTFDNRLHIRASSGVAALWGFNYYLKKYCNSQIGWQVKNINIPSPLPEVDDVVVASDRFRYYQNVCTASYSFVWWNKEQWLEHIEWMGFNGINIALAPVAQEAAWARIYRKLGMTEDEIDDHFTGPAFLAWLRMGNVRGWGGPLQKSWHDKQRDIQDAVIDYMYKLGMIPVLPSFAGHVPKAFSRLFPNSTFYPISNWNRFKENYCCLLFADPNDRLFKDIGKMFLKEITIGAGTNHIYSADPFNEISIAPWSSNLVEGTAVAIFDTMLSIDPRAVWLVQNWMFVHDPILWPKSQVKRFLTSVPNGRMLVVDLQSEQWPQYNWYDMYFGQPFIWSMLHNFGGTLGMFGNIQSINSDVYTARKARGSTMIGVGLTPEGINQNYVVYDLMLESAWRKEPVRDMQKWIQGYSERRYNCNNTGRAWHYLLKSVYSFEGLNKMRGKYVITRRPSFKIKPWAWYTSHDLMEAWRRFVLTPDCNSQGFLHDLVDVTRQALQYRAEQYYVNIVNQRSADLWTFNTSITQFLDVMEDLSIILATNENFTASAWLNGAKTFAAGAEEQLIYDINARNQITLWGPNGEITDYACKQWAELFHYYYTPRWRAFLTAALIAKQRNEPFDENKVQLMIRLTIEEQFSSINISQLPGGDAHSIAAALYEKWGNLPGLEDLPINVIPRYSMENTAFTMDNVEYTVSPQPNDKYTIVLSYVPLIYNRSSTAKITKGYSHRGGA